MTRSLTQATVALVSALGIPALLHAQTETRAAITRRYQANRAAFLALDSAAIMRLRHPGFFTVDRRGQRMSRDQFAARTRWLLESVERFDSLTFEITSWELHPDTVVLVVRQRSARQQRMPDGLVHDLRAGATQRETWVRTSGGWLMWRVDQVQPDPVLVDGQLVDGLPR